MILVVILFNCVLIFLLVVGVFINLTTKVFIMYLFLFVHCFTCLFFSLSNSFIFLLPYIHFLKFKTLKKFCEIETLRFLNSSNRKASGHEVTFLKTPTSIILHPFNFQSFTDIYILINTERASSLIGATGGDTLLQRLLPLCHLLPSLLSHKTGRILTMKHILPFIGYWYKVWEDCVKSTYLQVLQLTFWTRNYFFSFSTPCI